MSGRIPLDFSEIPDRVFIPAVMVREILRVRPLTYKEKQSEKRGGPDILVNPMVGKQYKSNRDYIINHFTYLTGKKVNIRGWRSSKMYVVVRPSDIVIMVMQVPLNLEIHLENEVANSGNRKSGDYIVCLTDAAGEIDRSTASVVPASLFHKIGYITPNPVIEKAVANGSKSKKFSRLDKIGHGNSNIAEKVTSIKKAIIPVNAPKDAPLNNNIPNNRANNPMSKVGQPVSVPVTNQDAYRIQSKSKFKVTANVLNEYGSRVGFVIQAENGATKKIDRDTAVKMCLNHMISNMTAVRANGGFFFRGVGESLDELPTDYI